MKKVLLYFLICISFVAFLSFNFSFISNNQKSLKLTLTTLESAFADGEDEEFGWMRTEWIDVETTQCFYTCCNEQCVPTGEGQMQCYQTVGTRYVRCDWIQQGGLPDCTAGEWPILDIWGCGPCLCY